MRGIPGATVHRDETLTGKYARTDINTSSGSPTAPLTESRVSIGGNYSIQSAVTADSKLQGPTSRACIRGRTETRSSAASRLAQCANLIVSVSAEGPKTAAAAVAAMTAAAATLDRGAD